jgi:hypothetical protein
MQLASDAARPRHSIAAWQHFYASCQNGADPVSYFRVMNARSPGEEMVRWFHERRLMHETGGNLDAYRNRILQEALQNPEFMAQLQASGAVPSQPQRSQQARGENGQFVPHNSRRSPGKKSASRPLCLA